MIENYTNDSMVRESPHYDFRIIFNATFGEIIRRIQFSTYFWSPGKTDGIMAVFFVKKVDNKKENERCHGEEIHTLWFSDYFQYYFM